MTAVERFDETRSAWNETGGERRRQRLFFSSSSSVLFLSFFLSVVGFIVAFDWFGGCLVLSQIVLVRGKIISVEGKVVVGSLGLVDKNAAPVLMEPIGRGVGGTIKVSGDYKVTVRKPWQYFFSSSAMGVALWFSSGGLLSKGSPHLRS